MSPEFYKSEKGTLESGIFFDGETRREYVIREEKLSDNLRETEQIEEEFGKSLTLDEQKLAIAKNCVQFSRRVKIEGIPSEKLTAAFLLDNLSSRDYSALVFAKMKLDREIFRALGIDPDADQGDSAKKN
jgi:hypothetical protein